MAIETRMHVEKEVVSVPFSPFSGFVLFSFYKAQHTSQLAAHDVMLTMFTVFWLDVCNGLLFWHAGFLCCLCAGVRSSFS